jgi:protein-S-isoprenylcysteine O-methyltransferase Ste14
MDQVHAVLASLPGGAVIPLVYRHGAAETVFIVALATWLVFEFVMRVRQRMLASGPPSRDPTFFVLVAALAGSIILAEVLGRRGGLPWPGGVAWPFAAGIALILAGIALATDVWSLVVVAVVAGAGLTVRIHAEERQLTQALGAEYEQFAAGRKRLVPGVW